MSETTAVVSSDVQVAAEPVSENVSQFIGEDGSFKEGWQKALIPEDLQNEIVFKEMPNPNVKDTIKMLGNLQKAIGKKGLIQPTDSSTPSEWDMFYKALGRPDKPDGYQLEYPKDMPVEENAEMKKVFTEFAYKNGLSQKQMAGLYSLYNEFGKNEILQMQQAQEQAQKDSEIQLRTELGTKFDEYIHIGNRMISENTVEGEQRDKLVSKFGNDPDFIKFVGNVGKKFMEHKGIPAETERSTGMTPFEAKAKMDEIAKTLADKTLVYNNPGLQARLTTEMAGWAKLVSGK